MIQQKLASLVTVTTVLFEPTYKNYPIETNVVWITAGGKCYN